MLYSDATLRRSRWGREGTYKSVAQMLTQLLMTYNLGRQYYRRTRRYYGRQELSPHHEAH